jgi:hypothetical protein
MSTVRARNLELLRSHGFRVAPSLPETREATSHQVRPLEEIASRLMALDAVFTWVAFPEGEVESSRVVSYIENNRLTHGMTDGEREIVAQSRTDAHEQHVDTIGWRLENMWPLAWVLGFEPAPAFDGQIPEEVTRAILLDFLPGLGGSVQNLLDQSSPRTIEQVVEMEDRFYCLHNAVRSAQLGGDTVPAGFHPIADGGAIHERRHSLSWCLSPGTDWDDLDLST